jgi:tetratricopeptide (TPR) repeat protein
MMKTSVSEQDSRKLQKPLPASGPVRVASLFRRIDWLALLLTFVVIFVTYLLTLAPELTLEDSGELVTGSFYAGIPHPPGYPVWTIYSWLWTTLLPIGNMAWRVAVAEAFSGALACGLLALLVSRGSSLFMEGIEDLKNMTGKWESAICLVCGLVAGALLGLDGFMWKESVVVNRIAVFSVPWMLLVLVFLLRWIYAPHQMRYAYLAAFIFGVCMTTHQSLIVAAIAFEVALACGNEKLGRDAFFGNFLLYAIYMVILFTTGHHPVANISKPGLFLLFNLVGLGSLVASLWLATRTRGLGSELKHVIFMAVLWGLGVSFYFYMPISGMTDPPMQWGYPRTVEGFFHALTRGQYEQPSPTNLMTDPGRFLLQMWMLLEGIIDEFSPAFLFVGLVPFVFFFKMQRRERAWLVTLATMYLFLGCFLMVLLNPSHDRASADLIKVFLTSSHTIVTCLIGYGLALTAAYMATHYQRFRIWGLMGGIVATVLAVYSLWDATGRHFFGRAGKALSGGELMHWIGQAFAKDTFGLPIFGSLLLLGITFAFIVVLLLYRRRGPLLITLCLFLATPLYSGLAHWWGSEQRNHWFGYWFGHDMFTPPFKDAKGQALYPEMARNAVLYGGTDPGRFCPEYMIYTESFTPHDCQPKWDQKFDRRDVYIITQNALADGTYLCFVRSHYNRSMQIDPPFFQDLLRSQKEREQNYETNVLARMVTPLDKVFTKHGDRVEKRRRTYTSWFKEEDFKDLPAFVAKLRGAERGPRDPVSEYLYQTLTPETQKLLAGKDEAAVRTHLATDLNVLLERELVIKKQIEAKQQEKAGIDQTINDGEGSDRLREKQAKLAQEIAELSKRGSPLWDPARFKQVPISEYLANFIKENPQSHTRIRLNRLLLEAAYPKEIAQTIPGVYPDREIYIATPDDSQRCFTEYLNDAQKRLAHDSQFPGEPRQLKPGEDVHIVDNRVTVAGQVAVMAINGLLTKVMFDHNPQNEFYVEESFPLDWMYPHLTPFGVIMKINRQPLPDLTEDILQRDHDFWSQYSARLCGNWLTYDTSVKEIADWIEKVYLRHDFTGFKGDRKFFRDEDAQKAFSKLRSSIGGIYSWRLLQAPVEYRPKSNEQLQRLFKEADFAFKQAFAICPYSPEAVFRYADLLWRPPFNRVDDAILVAKTCLKLDPYNSGVMGLLSNLEAIKNSGAGTQDAYNKARAELQRLQEEVQKNPNNFPAAIELARAYYQMQQIDAATSLLDRVLNAPNVDANSVANVARAYFEIHNFPKLELALEKYVKLAPDNPEGWYNLAGLKSSFYKTNEALASLGKALELNAARRQQDPKTHDLLEEAKKDPQFTPLRGMPEFQKLVPGQ